MTEERKIKAALKVDASQIHVPADLLQRINRQADGLAPVRPGLWSRLKLGPKLELIAACILLVGLLGLAAFRNLNAGRAPAGGHEGPGTEGPVSDPQRVNSDQQAVDAVFSSNELGGIPYVDNFPRSPGKINSTFTPGGKDMRQLPATFETTVAKADAGYRVTLVMQWTEASAQSSFTTRYAVSDDFKTVVEVNQDGGMITVYRNTEFGFSFSLPASWKGYKIVTGQWEGLVVGGLQGHGPNQMGPMISVRHPQWTEQNQRQDIPIMVFTITQWNLLQEGGFHIGAAPVGPRELARNPRYVFALPARYNYAFPPGYEEVESILSSNPLQPTETR